MEATGTPRWVKVFAVILVAVVVAIVLVRVIGVGGDHGPKRHGAPLAGFTLGG